MIRLETTCTHYRFKKGLRAGVDYSNVPDMIRIYKNSTKSGEIFTPHKTSIHSTVFHICGWTWYVDCFEPVLQHSSDYD